MDKKYLLEAELKAKALFNEIIKLSLIEPGKTEEFLSSQIFDLAFKMFNTKVHWHKRIVRTGSNTIHPYNENPPNLIIKEDDILFLDFGPVFDSWEADLGRTYVLGNDQMKLRMKNDVEECWYLGKQYYDSKKNILSSELYEYIVDLAKNRSWKFGNEHCGHLIGQFPHERIDGNNFLSYIHPENHVKMRELDDKGRARDWILEIHFVDYELSIGGFFEQVLTFE
jgi:Xaa-Pro dipeptidase